MTLSQSPSSDGQFSRLYTSDSNNLTGNYTVTTNSEGENFLEINTQVMRDTPFSEKSSFGVGWGIGLSKEEDSATEVYFALWSN